MTQEEKQLLLKDLCTRLPYEVKAEARGWDDEKEEEVFVPVTVYFINPNGYVYFCNNEYDITYCGIEACRPFLRPMSSMTEEEQRTLDSMCNGVEMVSRLSGLKMFDKAFDWLNAHHFDYRGLIEKGFALEAPEGMYKTE